jgi:tetratricopeptide (TPR) repeat protein
MYCQLFKENLLTTKIGVKCGIKEFIEFCRRQYNENENDIALTNDLEKRYTEESPIWWYTQEAFLYKKLNEALRNMNIEVLMKMGFFIQDLHQEIKRWYSKLKSNQIPTTVYRGQGLSNKDFEKLKVGGFWSCNSFLSTSQKESATSTFIGFHQKSIDTKAIIFEIKIDPSISSVPFAPIKDLSYYKHEDEILFSMSTVFRIGEIREVGTNLWKVYLTLVNDRDPLLKRLTDHIRISLGDGDEWHRLGQLTIKMGQFNKALEIYQELLQNIDHNNEVEKAFLHNQLGYVWKQKENLKEAFSHYKESIKISRAYMSETDPRLSSTYSNIGGILKKLGDPNEALKWYELVLKIDLAAPKPNQLEIAIDHNNIGSVLDDLGKYADALKSYEQALDIKLSHLPPHHPSLASTYSNIGLIHRKMGDCSTASVYYKKTLEIQQKSLPPNHPSLSVTHGKLATVLEELHKYKEAIEHAEQAVKIANAAFGSSHPEATKRQRYLDELRQKN